MPVDRFTVSLDTELLAAFDAYIASRGYGNRSEAVRDMIRDLLLSTRHPAGPDPIVAFLTLVCDYRTSDAPQRVRDIARAHADLLQGTLTVPIDDRRDAMCMALRGPSERVHGAANQIQSLRGVAYCRVSAVPET